MGEEAFYHRLRLSYILPRNINSTLQKASDTRKTTESAERQNLEPLFLVRVFFPARDATGNLFERQHGIFGQTAQLRNWRAS